MSDQGADHKTRRLRGPAVEPDAATADTGRQTARLAADTDKTPPIFPPDATELSPAEPAEARPETGFIDPAALSDTVPAAGAGAPRAPVVLPLPAPPAQRLSPRALRLWLLLSAGLGLAAGAGHGRWLSPRPSPARASLTAGGELTHAGWTLGLTRARAPAQNPQLLLLELTVRRRGGRLPRDLGGRFLLDVGAASRLPAFWVVGQAGRLRLAFPVTGQDKRKVLRFMPPDAPPLLARLE